MIKKGLSRLYRMLPASIQHVILKNRIRSVMKLKQETIRGFQKKYNHNVHIETGTFLGDMIDAQRNQFKKIFSIELQPKLAQTARERFKEYEHINILQGDSGKLLREILKNVNEPAIFWLDAHYSGGLTAKGEKDCPIYEELDVIFEKNFNHVLLIDDARCFNGEGDYPDLKSLNEYIQKKDARYTMTVEDDIIRFTI